MVVKVITNINNVMNSSQHHTNSITEHSCRKRTTLSYRATLTENNSQLTRTSVFNNQLTSINKMKMITITIQKIKCNSEHEQSQQPLLTTECYHVDMKRIMEQYSLVSFIKLMPASHSVWNEMLYPTTTEAN